MKNILLLLAGTMMAFGASAQFLRLQIEEVPNSGQVPGTTYRVYAVMMNEGDIIDAVFAEEGSPLELISTKPFYQHPKGGPLSIDVQRFDLQNDAKLTYDTWFTIGAMDNYNNYVMAFQMDTLAFKTFESGQNFSTVKSAWFVTPDKRQAMADMNGRILLMQFTTAGRVTGKLNIHGRTRATFDDNGDVIEGNEVIEVRGIEFTAG